MNKLEQEVELVGFELVENTNVSYLNGWIAGMIKSGWKVQGESYRYVDEVTGKTKHVVPMAKYEVKVR
jgi:hypothetical protein